MSIMTVKDLKKKAPKGEFLAYINKEEAAALKRAGGSGHLVNGIPSFVGSDYSEKGNANTSGYQGGNRGKGGYQGSTGETNKTKSEGGSGTGDFNPNDKAVGTSDPDIAKQEKERYEEQFGGVSPTGYRPRSFNIFDYGKKYIRNRKKGLYNIVPNNPKNELKFLSSLRITNPAKYDTLPQNLKDVLEATDQDSFVSYKDSPKFSYDDFESLTQFDDGAFAKYAAKYAGAPGLLYSGDMSRVGDKFVSKYAINPDGTKGAPLEYGYGPVGTGDGPNAGQGYGEGYGQINSGIIEDVEDAEPYNQFTYRMGDPAEAANVTRASYIFNKGGRVPAMEGGIMGTRARRAFGGIMDRVTGRKAYGLGSIFKSVKKAASKVLKSDLGKAALLAYGAYYTGGKLGGAGGFDNFAQLGRSTMSGLGTLKNTFGLNKLPKEPSFLDKAIKFGKLAGGAYLLGKTKLGEAPVDQMPGGGKRGGRMKDSQGNEALPYQLRAEIDDAYESGDPERIAAIEKYYAFLPPTAKEMPYEEFGEEGYRTTVATGGRIGYNGGGSVITLMDGTKVQIPAGSYNSLGSLKDRIYSSSKGDLLREEIVKKLSFANGGRIGKAEGGLMDLGGMEKDYRAEGGFVPIGEYEKKDDVPARLSVNEFVFTADAVRGAGQGDIDKGAEIMENMMENLENGGTVSEESQGNKGAQQMFETSQRLGEVV